MIDPNPTRPMHAFGQIIKTWVPKPSKSFGQASERRRQQQGSRSLETEPLKHNNPAAAQTNKRDMRRHRSPSEGNAVRPIASAPCVHICWKGLSTQTGRLWPWI